MKKIAIVGGGISALALCHFLKQRFNSQIDIALYERNDHAGGNIQTQHASGVCFEYGPTGFMNNAPTTMALINDIGLNDELILSDAASKRRYIQMDGALHLLPLDPISFIKTPILSPKDKWLIVQGLFKKNISKDQSIDQYVSMRFGHGAASRLVDPFISGIYAGDTKRLHMEAAFPKFIKSKPRGVLCSFKQGMGQLIDVLSKRYQAHIHLNKEISDLRLIEADIKILATPSYISSKIIEPQHRGLAQLLEQCPYAPVAVVGFLFDASALKRKPDGFGYLVPSNQGKDILGVLIESNVYPSRFAPGQVLFRVMLGGAHHPAIINDDPNQIIKRALDEIHLMYGITQEANKTFFKLWPKAIPQYELNYPQWRQALRQELGKMPNVYLTGNYLDGISVNDCIHNASVLAGQIQN